MEPRDFFSLTRYDRLTYYQARTAWKVMGQQGWAPPDRMLLLAAALTAYGQALLPLLDWHHVIGVSLKTNPPLGQPATDLVPVEDEELLPVGRRLTAAVRGALTASGRRARAVAALGTGRTPPSQRCWTLVSCLPDGRVVSWGVFRAPAANHSPLAMAWRALPAAEPLIDDRTFDAKRQRPGFAQAVRQHHEAALAQQGGWADLQLHPELREVLTAGVCPGPALAGLRYDLVDEEAFRQRLAGCPDGRAAYELLVRTWLPSELGRPDLAAGNPPPVPALPAV